MSSGEPLKSLNTSEEHVIMYVRLTYRGRWLSPAVQYWGCSKRAHQLVLAFSGGVDGGRRGIIACAYSQ